MLNDFLLSFFFCMPAVVAVVSARDLKNPLPRAIMFWGGLVAVVLVAMVAVPMLACDGHLMKSYSGCIGGAGVADLFNTMAPAIEGAAMIFVLGCIPLAVITLIIEFALNLRKKAT